MKRSAQPGPGERPENAPLTPEALERLHQMDEFKHLFINAAAHELSTPLTPIRLQVHMLKTGLRGDLTQEARRSIEIVDRNVERLHTLVRDLMDVSRLQAGRFPIDMHATDLKDVIDEAVESYREPAATAGLTLEAHVERGLVAMADGRRLVQVLFNLISNAIKFTPGKGRIDIDARRAGGEAIVSVGDNGIGFAEKDRDRLFHAFSQIYRPEVGFPPGAGLGLFISRSVVELHGGRIWADSEGPGKGSTFSFSVPLAGSPQAGDTPVRAIKQATTDSDFSRRVRQLV